MLFNSPEFIIFLPLVFVLYWFVFNRNLRAQNALVLAASYFFYGWWDWRFLGLILVSTLVDYLAGQRMALAEDKPQRHAQGKKAQYRCGYDEQLNIPFHGEGPVAGSRPA
jgi:D-alanyl-lipoteichoic acid acyltransferase DltB (MBOAT superfamily)